MRYGVGGTRPQGSTTKLALIDDVDSFTDIARLALDPTNKRACGPSRLPLSSPLRRSASNQTQPEKRHHVFLSVIAHDSVCATSSRTSASNCGQVALSSYLAGTLGTAIKALDRHTSDGSINVHKHILRPALYVAFRREPISEAVVSSSYDPAETVVFRPLVFASSNAASARFKSV
jgi:hypothetical protein